MNVGKLEEVNAKSGPCSLHYDRFSRLPTPASFCTFVDLGFLQITRTVLEGRSGAERIMQKLGDLPPGGRHSKIAN